MKKTLFWLLIYALFLGVLAVIITLFNYYGVTRVLVAGLKDYHVFLLLPLLITYLLFFIAHESGHALTFAFLKIKIQSIIVYNFGLTRNSKNQLRPFCTWPILLPGGMVTFLTPPIHNDQDYEKTLLILKKSLLAGPIASIIYYVLFTTISFFVFFLSKSPFWISFLTLALVLNSILLVYTMYSSSLGRQNYYGDFKAYQGFQKNPSLVLSLLLQYHNYQDQETTKYLLEKVKAIFHSPRFSTYRHVDQILGFHYLANFLLTNQGDRAIASRFPSLNSLTDEKEGTLLYTYLIGIFYYYYDVDRFDSLIKRLSDATAQDLIDLKKNLLLLDQPNSPFIPFAFDKIEKMITFYPQILQKVLDQYHGRAFSTLEQVLLPPSETTLNV
jgi:hypothetical protein